MLHTKFSGNRPTGSGEEDFEGFLPYMGVAAINDTTVNYPVPGHFFFSKWFPDNCSQQTRLEPYH